MSDPYVSSSLCYVVCCRCGSLQGGEDVGVTGTAVTGGREDVGATRTGAGNINKEAHELVVVREEQGVGEEVKLALSQGQDGDQKKASYTKDGGENRRRHALVF